MIMLGLGHNLCNLLVHPAEQVAALKLPLRFWVSGLRIHDLSNLGFSTHLVQPSGPACCTCCCPEAPSTHSQAQRRLLLDVLHAIG